MNEPIPFTKMSGAGNDFIIIDNRAGILNGLDLGGFARQVCTRRVSLGGDELMLIEAATAGGDFSLRTINPDGVEVNMCGNAARCVARYAVRHSLAEAAMTIDTLGGPVTAQVVGDEARIGLQITASPQLNLPLQVDGEQLVLNTVEISGTPHVVVYRENVAKEPGETIRRLGASIRRHPRFPNGTNANFVEVLDEHTLWQRTYERGVEGETLACGTGAAASAVIGARLGKTTSPLSVHVRGGALSVAFEQHGEDTTGLTLGGEARFIAEGVLFPEAWK